MQVKKGDFVPLHPFMDVLVETHDLAYCTRFTKARVLIQFVVRFMYSFSSTELVYFSNAYLPYLTESEAALNRAAPQFESKSLPCKF